MGMMYKFPYKEPPYIVVPAVSGNSQILPNFPRFSGLLSLLARHAYV